MTTFLIMLSIFLNILAFFAIVVLYLRQSRLSEAERKQEKIINEMEEIISNYLVQMKEENDEFLKRMQKVDRKVVQPAEKRTKEHHDVSEKIEDAEPEKQLTFITKKIPVKTAANAYQKYAQPKSINISAEDEIELPPIEVIQEEAEKKDIKEETLLSQVLDLQKKGFTEEAIAKKLNRGKTEIALLLKFNQN